MSQRQQLERIFEIDRRIRAGLYPNASTLADNLEVRRRVILREAQEFHPFPPVRRFPTLTSPGRMP